MIRLFGIYKNLFKIRFFVICNQFILPHHQLIAMNQTTSRCLLQPLKKNRIVENVASPLAWEYLFTVDGGNIYDISSSNTLCRIKFEKKWDIWLDYTILCSGEIPLTFLFPFSFPFRMFVCPLCIRCTIVVNFTLLETI